jgi:hypothetical protein
MNFIIYFAIITLNFVEKNIFCYDRTTDELYIIFVIYIVCCLMIIYNFIYNYLGKSYAMMEHNFPCNKAMGPNGLGGRGWIVIFEKLFFKFFYVYLLLEKVVNKKHFPVKEKFGLISMKVFSFYFERKTFSESCEKFRNVILFADYIKFDSQTFDCYIYFVLNIYFSISSLRI